METYLKQKCFPGILKLNSFTPLDKYLGNITTKLVFFTIMGDYVWKIVCQLFGLGSVCYWVCQFFGWWLCLVLGLSGVSKFGKYVIMTFKSRDGVSVGLFY